MGMNGLTYSHYQCEMLSVSINAFHVIISMDNNFWALCSLVLCYICNHWKTGNTI